MNPTDEAAPAAHPARVIKLVVAYDGSSYHGWQHQPGQRTIQGVIEAAILKITGEAAHAASSGRTDAGVHALAQVVSFETHSKLPAHVLGRAINSELDDDVTVRQADDAPSGFHALTSAVKKRYRYVIHDGPFRDIFRRQYVWHFHGRLDAEAMHRAARAWIGTHDFASFENQGSPRQTSTRTVFDASVERGAGEGGSLISFEVEADGFLYNMVRNMAGTLVEVGRGAKSAAWAADVLAARNRRKAGMTAPPQGLFLVKVDYGRDESERKKRADE